MTLNHAYKLDNIVLLPELDDQWQFIAKFPYSEKGTVRVRVQFKSDADCLLTDIDENNDVSPEHFPFPSLLSPVERGA